MAAPDTLPSGEDHPTSSAKTRSSCDRCRMQKLRCVRGQGKTSCERCLRLKTRCRFSPRTMRTARQVQGQPVSRLHIHDCIPAATTSTFTRAPDLDLLGTDVTDSRWLFPSSGTTDIAVDAAGTDVFGDLTNITPLGYSGFTDLQLASAQDKTNGNASSPWLPETWLLGTNNGGGTSTFSLARSLAELNVKICECAARLPFEKNKLGASSEGVAGHPVPEAQKPIRFVFDELFSLTSEFNSIIESLCTPGYHGNSTVSSMSLELPDLMKYQECTSHSQPSSQAYHQPVPGFPVAPLLVDEATMYMVTSCHCRLTGIYTSIFEGIEACIKHSIRPQTSSSWAIVLPQLQVSSLALPLVQVDDKTPPTSATSTMYIMMVTMLSSQLWEKMAGIIRSGGRYLNMDNGTETSAPGIFSSGAAGPAWNLVMDKTTKLTESIASVQGLLGK